MNGSIYKAVPDLTKEEILEVCEFESIPKYGKVMTCKEFMDAVKTYCITDCDGDGDLILYDRVVKGTSLWIYNRTVYFEDRLFVPFDELYSIFGNDMKIIWFNK